MKLGELFVDLGVNSGSAFNTLTGFAFKFNQLFDLAKNFGGTLDSVFGKTPEYANKLNRLNQVTSLSRNTLQAMSYAAKTSKTSLDSMVGQITNLDEAFLRFRRGDSDLLRKLSPLGITSKNILESKNSLELMEKVIKRVQAIPDDRTRYGFLQQFGLSVEDYNAYADFLENREHYEKRQINLTDEEIKNLDRIYKLRLEIEQKNEGMYNKFRAQTAPVFEELMNYIQEIKEGFYDAVSGADSFGEAVGKACDFAVKELDKVWSNVADAIDETGFLQEFGRSLYRLFKSMLDVLIDSGRLIGYLGKAVALLFKGKFVKAGEQMDAFFENSALFGDVAKWQYEDEQRAKNKAIKKQSASGYKTRDISNEELTDNQKLAYRFFRSKGYSDSSARALMGNIMQESSFNPTAIGDKGASFGIAQWRDSRRRNLEEFAKNRGKSASDFLTQLEFMVSEKGEAHKISPSVLNKMSLSEATKHIVDKYERASDKKTLNRINFAEGFYGMEGHVNSAGNTYNITNALTVTSTPENLVSDVVSNGRKVLYEGGNSYIRQANSSTNGA